MDDAPGPRHLLLVVEAAFAGVGRHVLDLVEGLVARGLIVDVLYGAERAEPGFADRLAAAGARHVGASRGSRAVGWRDLQAIADLRRFRNDHGPYDVIHGHASKAGALVRLAPGSRRATIVYTPNAFVTQSPDLSAAGRFVYSSVERVLARRTDILVYVSPEEAAHGAALHLRPRSSAIVPNGIPLRPLPTRAEARRALGLPEDGPIVGFVGRLSAQKSVDTLLRAMPGVVAARPDARLAVVGEGEDADDLQALARQLEVDGVVTWCGRRDGQAAMPAFDVFALPSRYEGFPYVVLEALWAGIPVVATDRCNASLVLSDERCGTVVPRDPGRLAEAVIARLASPGGDAAAAARREVAARHSVDAMINEILTLYRSARSAG